VRRFYFRLALALGTTVGELLGRISSRELSEWMAYYELEPWGTVPADYRAGIVAAVTANANRDPKRQRRPFAPQDFMPVWSRPQPRRQSPEEQRVVIEMWQAVLTGQGRPGRPGSTGHGPGKGRGDDAEPRHTDRQAGS